MSNNKTLGDEHFKIKLDTPLALSRHAHIIFNSDHQAAKAWLETLNFSEQEWNLSKRKLKKIDTFLPKKEAISECYYNIFSPRRKFLPVVSCFDYERLPCLQREEMALVAKVKMRGYWRPQPTAVPTSPVHCPVEQTRSTTTACSFTKLAKSLSTRKSKRHKKTKPQNLSNTTTISNSQGYHSQSLQVENTLDDLTQSPNLSETSTFETMQVRGKSITNPVFQGKVTEPKKGNNNKGDKLLEQLIEIGKNQHQSIQNEEIYKETPDLFPKTVPYTHNRAEAYTCTLSDHRVINYQILKVTLPIDGSISINQIISKLYQKKTTKPIEFTFIK